MALRRSYANLVSVGVVCERGECDDSGKHDERSRRRRPPWNWEQQRTTRPLRRRRRRATHRRRRTASRRPRTASRRPRVTHDERCRRAHGATTIRIAPTRLRRVKSVARAWPTCCRAVMSVCARCRARAVCAHCPARAVTSLALTAQRRGDDDTLRYTRRPPRSASSTRLMPTARRC